ncbi:MAG TPA: hypothetical protein VMI75_37110 [Polyangiaceae bacterium]|nr:hypothetical protein [Polyangiaceae bacterium]
MAPGIRRFAAVAAVISIAAGVGAFALACSSSSPVALPQGQDGSTGQEASTDAPATSDVAESGNETSTPDGSAGGDSGDAASDAPAGDAATGDGPDA